MTNIYRLIVLLVVALALSTQVSALQICDYYVPEEAGGHTYQRCLTEYCSGYTGTCASLCAISCRTEVDQQPKETQCCGFVYMCGPSGVMMFCCSNYCN